MISSSGTETEGTEKKIMVKSHDDFILNYSDIAFGFLTLTGTDTKLEAELDKVF